MRDRVGGGLTSAWQVLAAGQVASQARPLRQQHAGTTGSIVGWEQPCGGWEGAGLVLAGFSTGRMIRL